jgi:DNA repair exonuclease SbcCD ATPase subunit
MILTLSKFKCWNELTLEIPLNKVTLIKGRSGKGKSTILNAIDWVIYGEVKKVGPRHAPTSKTNVTLKMNNIYISRTKNPNKLILEQTFENDKKIIYEDLNAQSKINELWGDYELWLATSYMQQMSHNYFLASPNTAKIDLLNKISFHDQDPTEYITKIEQILDKNKIFHQYQLDEYNKKYIDYEYDIKNLLSEDIYNDSIDNLNNLKNNELLLMTRKQEYEMQNFIVEHKNKELLEYKHKLLLLVKPVYDKTLIENQSLMDDLNNNKTLLYNYLKELKSIDENVILMNTLKEELIKYENITLQDYTFTLDELQETITIEKIYSDNAELFKYLDIDHDEETMNDYINHLNDVLQAQERLEKELILQHLMDKVDCINTKLKDLSDVTICNIKNDDKNDIECCEKNLNQLNLNQGELQHQLKHLIETKDAIKCPHCDQDVLYKKGTLIKVSISDEDMKTVESQLKINNQNIKELEKKITMMKLKKQENEKNIHLEKIKYEKSMVVKNTLTEELNDINMQIKDLNSQIIKLPKTEHPLLKLEEKNQIYKILGKLKNIKIVSLPSISSTIIKKYLHEKELHDKKINLKNQYDNVMKKIPAQYLNENLNINAFECFLKDYDEYIIKYNHIEKNINHLEEQLNKIVLIDNPVYELNQIKNHMDILNEKIKLHQETKLLREQHLKLINDKEELTKLTNKVDYLTNLKTKAIQIECEILKNIVNHINFNMYDMSQTMFEDDIKIEMNLFKKLKAIGKIKQDVNFSILYKGAKFDSILELSVGESNRASIALTLALNKLSSSPFIIFDEALKSLDPELKLDIIKTIKYNISNTIILAEHGYIDSSVDYIIDVELL